jgi:hypothetical protein
MNINVSSVTNHFPNPQDGFTTTTSGSVSSGASSVGLSSTGDYSNNDIVVLIIDPADADKKQVLVGTMDVSGSQLTSVVWVGGTNQAHSSGATIVDYYDAAHIKMITKGILVHANQDGTLKANSVDSDQYVNGSIDTEHYADASITPAKWTNPYKFSAYLGANQTLLDSTQTVVAFDNEFFDTNNNFDVTVNKGRYTVPVSGFYQINTCLNITAGAVAHIATVLKNGSELIRLGQVNTDNYAGGSVLLQLAAGDYIEIGAFQNSGISKVISGGASIPAITTFNGYLVSQT